MLNNILNSNFIENIEWENRIKEILLKILIILTGMSIVLLLTAIIASFIIASGWMI